MLAAMATAGDRATSSGRAPPDNQLPFHGSVFALPGTAAPTTGATVPTATTGTAALSNVRNGRDIRVLSRPGGGRPTAAGLLRTTQLVQQLMSIGSTVPTAGVDPL